MRELIEVAPKWIAVLSFAVVVFAVVHEWGYFAVIGPHLQTVVSPYDYAVNALVWLPSTTILAFGTWGYLAIVGRTKEGRPTVSRYNLSLLVLGVAGFTLAYLLVPGLPFVFVLSWIALTAVFWLIPKYFPFDKLPDDWQFHRLVVIVPAMMVLMYGYGATSATNDLRKADDIYFVHPKGDNAEARARVMLRSFERGILVRDLVRERVEFVRWEDIALLSVLAERPGSSRSLFCKSFGICLRQEPLPPVP
jgi:hypothetical protein